MINPLENLPVGKTGILAENPTPVKPVLEECFASLIGSAGLQPAGCCQDGGATFKLGQQLGTGVRLGALWLRISRNFCIFGQKTRVNRVNYRAIEANSRKKPDFKGVHFVDVHFFHTHSRFDHHF
jgi:hypothetical protein